MGRIYQLSRVGLRLIYKVRHHRGHGIHSPFVFNLINKVIEEKSFYNAYEDISTHLDSLPEAKLKATKYDLLSFRLTNYFEAKNVLEIGSAKGVNSLCITAPSRKIVCACVETCAQKRLIAQKLYTNWRNKIGIYSELPVLTEKQDAVFIDLKNYKADNTLPLYVSQLLHEQSFVVIRGIRTNRRHKAVWEAFKAIDGRSAALDLFNIGIIFFDRQLYRWEYQISF